jgi:proteasome accessory factor A
VASDPQVFQRLIGLETEYAIRLPADLGRSLGRYPLFLQFADALRRLIPAVEARHMKEGVFHAAGGAVWFEAERPAAGGGLIEGATPECRSPRQLLAAQRAQDQLLAEAVQRAFGSPVALLKNDRDAQGNIYGAQENYSARYASGWRLRLWHALLVLLFPLVLITWIVLWIVAGGTIAYVLFASLLYVSSERFLRRPERLARVLFGCTLQELGHAAPTGPAWLEAALSIVSRVVTAPAAFAFHLAILATGFVPQRRQLLPFLISRPILAGSGMLDDAGRFRLADKAPAINCLCGFGGLLADRPIFNFGHFFKTIYADAVFSPREYLSLFLPRQRLQIALGDSNLCEVSEYLRVGTTLLVLDCIEAGEMPPVPKVARPLSALRKVCGDPTLRAEIPLWGARGCTALQLQRFYLEACRRFLDSRPEAPDEARHVLALWEETLEALSDDPQSLVGSLDWVTKWWLLTKAGDGAGWAARKKIDLRYHELSPEGYYFKLCQAGVCRRLLTDEEIELARRNPPSGTPASVRGRYIREFAGGPEPISANWQAVYIGSGRRAKIVRLADFRRHVPPAPPGKDEQVEQA